MITSSAVASSVGGTVRPSALAVLRLMAGSNLVGCKCFAHSGRIARCGHSPEILSTRPTPEQSHRLIKSHDLNPIRPFAGRIASNCLQGAALGLDRVHREHVRFLARDDDELAGRVDVEPARLLLRRRASEIDQLSARAINAERPNRARRALGGVEEAAVRGEVKIRGPDVVIGVAARGLVRAGVPTAPRGIPGTSFVSGGRTETELSPVRRPVLGSSASVVTVPVSSFST